MSTYVHVCNTSQSGAISEKKVQVPVYARKVRLVVGSDSCPCHRYYDHDSCESLNFFEARRNQENGVKLSLENKGIYIVQVLMTARLGEK